MKISLFPGSVPGALASLPEIITQGVEAERDGFDGFWVPHLSNRGFDALTVISLIGSRTESVELGTAVVPTYPRHPTAMAQQAMTSQVACQGRLVLGIGPSHQGNVEDAWGLIKQLVMRVETRPGFVWGSPYVSPMIVMRLLRRLRHGFKGTGPWSITVGY